MWVHSCYESTALTLYTIFAQNTTKLHSDIYYVFVIRLCNDIVGLSLEMGSFVCSMLWLNAHDDCSIDPSSDQMRKLRSMGLYFSLVM
jgi:hypothetical protein